VERGLIRGSFLPYRHFVQQAREAPAQNNGDVAVVTNVNPDSPGANAGIQVGDVIVALDGRPLKGKDFEAAVAGLKPGTQVSVSYARGSSVREVSLTVGSHN
jgi:S1-C subfamily serine protease